MEKEANAGACAGMPWDSKTGYSTCMGFATTRVATILECRKTPAKCDHVGGNPLKGLTGADRQKVGNGILCAMHAWPAQDGGAPPQGGDHGPPGGDTRDFATRVRDAITGAGTVDFTNDSSSFCKTLWNEAEHGACKGMPWDSKTANAACMKFATKERVATIFACRANHADCTTAKGDPLHGLTGADAAKVGNGIMCAMHAWPSNDHGDDNHDDETMKAVMAAIKGDKALGFTDDKTFCSLLEKQANAGKCAGMPWDSKTGYSTCLPLAAPIVPKMIACNKNHATCDTHKDDSVEKLSEEDKGKVGMGIMCAMGVWPKGPPAGGAQPDNGKKVLMKFLPKGDGKGDHPPRDGDDDGEDQGPRGDHGEVML